MDPQNPITYFAQTDARNKKIKFGIKAEDRLKHVYVIGKTGMGKSTLLENMAIQDIQNGEGMAFIDPHGSTAEKLLEYVPESRVKDVLYFAPFDMEYPIAFNIMEDVDPDKRHLVVNGLMATFEKIWADAWSARMSYILQYAIIALLEYPDATLLGINKMLSDKEYRKKVVDNVTDASARSFWIDEFGKYTERFAAEATPAIQNKVGQFTSNALVRNIIGQSKSSFDLREMMDNKKILIINLSKGQVGELNAKLIGSMLITKIYLAAMSRADKSKAELSKLPNFYLYVDEFQSFANKSFADILSEARKYKLNLTIAHQYVEQMEEEVRDAVFGNVGSMITFRVGAMDAELLEKEFAPIFTAEDLVNLGFTQIYLKLMIDGVSSAPFSATSLNTPPIPEISFKAQVIQSSRMTFGRPRKEVENSITKFYEGGRDAVPAPQGGQGGSNGGGGYGGGQGNGAHGYGNRNNGQSGGYTQQRSNPVIVIPRQSPPQASEHRPTQAPPVIESPKQQHATPPIRDDIKTSEQNKSVFAQAKADLERIQQSKPAVVPAPAVSVANTSQRSDDYKKLSLHDLRPEHEKAKVPTKENITSLKDALATVMAKPVTPPAPVVAPRDAEKKPEQPNVHKDAPQTHDTHQKSGGQTHDTRKTASSDESIKNYGQREVPEDVLRTLLQVDEPKVL